MTNPNNREDAYFIFKELHNPVYLFADLYALFAKVMELGIKDMFVFGESPDWKQLH